MSSESPPHSAYTSANVMACTVRTDRPAAAGKAAFVVEALVSEMPGWAQDIT